MFHEFVNVQEICLLALVHVLHWDLDGLDSGLNRYSQRLILVVSQAKNKTGWVD